MVSLGSSHLLLTTPTDSDVGGVRELLVKENFAISRQLFPSQQNVLRHSFLPRHHQRNTFHA